jgi:hypothetical protein
MLYVLKKILKTEHVAVDVWLVYIFKKIYHSRLLNLLKNEESKLLFIVGCQRSGTSLMNRIFTRDLNTSVYRESSRLSSSDPHKLRLNSYEEISREFKKNKAKYIILKPLVETQNILQLLEFFSGSKALWMYRNYKDFVQSTVNRFHIDVGINALKAIIEREPSNWRSEKVSDRVYSIISKHYSDEISPYDASALFWFARNQLFFDLDLENNPRVFMCRYEDLAAHPVEMVNEIYNFMDIEYIISKKIVQDINTRAIGKGITVELSPNIEELCQSLLTQMNNTYFAKHPTLKDKFVKNNLPVEVI